MDFYTISYREKKSSPPELYPDWTVGRSKDLMVRGRSFYAIWDEARGLWSTDEYDVQRLVDEDLHRYAEEERLKSGVVYRVQNLKSFNTKTWSTFRNYMQNISDNSHSLDEKLIFANTEVKKTDYASRRLPYALEEGRIDAWNELMDVLYLPEERDKIEWAIGAIISGDSKKIQKFLVFYGPAGSGKSTVLNVIQKLFDGYVATFDAKALGSSNNAFATEVFKTNPLVAIQHDGDLSKIDDNTKLNSIISHEDMTMNEKYKPSYTARVNAFLLMGTNQPVRISDAKSGIIRRLIDVRPTGKHVDVDRYHILMGQIEFELGAIAYHCLERYRSMGKNFYNAYRPVEMMLQTDIFYNYVESVYDIFKAQDGVSLKQAYELYKGYCAETGIEKLLPQYRFREELRNYFNKFEDKADVGGVSVRSYYSEFKHLTPPTPFKAHEPQSLELTEHPSFFDSLYPNQPAQYGKQSGYPGKKWENVTTTLSDLDTSKLHFVKVPENHIVIDFDLVDEDGEKDLTRNQEAAAQWPPTYAELSKSGAGLHLHYIYAGDVHELAGVYDVGIEIKTLLGDSSLRRKLTKCNNLSVATIGSGLPKKEKPMIDNKSIQSEKGLRELIERNLRKEIHPGTKPSIDFIFKILEDAYNEGLRYDVRDLRAKVLSFAAGSTNQAPVCIKVVQKMRFASEDAMAAPIDISKKPLVFFDVEVYPNLFVICWKYAGETDIVRMINPAAHEIEPLFGMRLVGFNNRRYDNHILYAAFLGYSVEEIYNLSQKIINTNSENVLFGEAYNLSYADIYDFSSKKQSLKKFEIELNIHHMELDLPWDEPVPKEKWNTVVDYCCNDVTATEVVFEDRKQDFVAREILADLSGLTVNHTTQMHTAKIIFGEEKYPQKNFVYTDLSKEFPGYVYGPVKNLETGKEIWESTYRGEVTGEGGYVYAEPGIYENVALLDVASMHPTSIEILNLFGPYTSKFAELKEARLAIKAKDYEKAKQLLNGRIGQFLGDVDSAEKLSYALKIVINIVYGLTSARFPNAFRDNRNVDNIVAKRGALFMIDLKHAVQEKGFVVAHIKTDSIKIPNATPEIIQFVVDFGKQYGYDFEHEVTYDKFCLVNDAVYIARADGEWTAVGAQFQHPYVYKTLFSREELTFDDYCETKSVTQGSMYLNFTDLSNDPQVKDELHHVGRCGSFVPVLTDGGVLWRIKDDKHYAVTGTKGHLWIEREVAANRENLDIDMTYFEKLRQTAFDAIESYGPFEQFVS
jgi:energy-coupling factor transporter ATP-binding protein EcfA2